MSNHVAIATGGASSRQGWIDTARGLCIVLVVLMHVVVGFEVALEQGSWIDPFIDWARLFRMPAFFLVSGLFMSRVAERPWPEFFDRKVLPFAYFYVVWLAINCLLKFRTWGDGGIGELAEAFALGLIQPFGILWFIYLLAVFFAVTKLFRRQLVLLWIAAAMLALTPVETGWYLVDQFCGRYVFFVSGALFAPRVITLAGWIAQQRVAATLLWLGWAVTSFWLASTVGSEGLLELPGVALMLGLAGSAGLVGVAVLIDGRLSWLDLCGRNSLPIYLAFFIPMALSRVLLIKSGLPFDIGIASLVLTVVSIAACLLLHRVVQGTLLRYLFERPPALGRLPSRKPA